MTMKAIYKRSRYFRNMRFRTKLVITYIALISIPLVILSYKYQSTAMEALSKLAGRNVYEIVKQNNQIIDAQLSKIEENSLSMITDHVLFNEIKNAKPNNGYALMQMDDKLTNVIDNYFSDYNEYYSANLITSYYTFGRRIISIPYSDFNKTYIYRNAMEAKGGLVWIPTYDFNGIFGNANMKNINFDYKYIFSAVRLLNCSYVDHQTNLSLDKSIERPILIVDIKEDLFRETFQNSIAINGSYFYIVDRDGRIISHSNKNKVATYDKSEWLQGLFDKKNGTSVVRLNGKRMIVCFSMLKTTGWMSVVIIPPNMLIKDIVPVIKAYTVYLALGLILVAILLAYIISGSITKPLKKLLHAIKKTGEGNFNTKIEIQNSDELGYLMDKFNDMNEKIQLLIDENYMTKIREKETEIMALNVQLNPHFLYNTLNIINWLAIENSQKTISSLLTSLSSMLQYTAYNYSELVNFEDDLKWLENYVYIMKCRFEDRFYVEYDIDPKLLKFIVPKLFLQPFVENAIIHGFEKMESGGIIKISAINNDSSVLFSVEDNGKGINTENVKSEKKDNKQNIGIKNVDRRIKLIYGDQYGVVVKAGAGNGTRVEVILPSREQSEN